MRRSRTPLPYRICCDCRIEQPIANYRRRDHGYGQPIGRCTTCETPVDLRPAQDRDCTSKRRYPTVAQTLADVSTLTGTLVGMTSDDDLDWLPSLTTPRVLTAQPGWDRAAVELGHRALPGGWDDRTYRCRCGAVTLDGGRHNDRSVALHLREALDPEGFRVASRLLSNGWTGDLGELVATAQAIIRLTTP